MQIILAFNAKLSWFDNVSGLLLQTDTNHTWSKTEQKKYIRWLDARASIKVSAFV
jgi:hypothetical protein